MMKQQFNRLTVTVQAWFTKTLNGSSGTSSFLMRGGEVPYQFEGKTNVKVGELEEFIKENKGAILDDLSELRKRAKEKGKEEKIQVTMFKEEFGVSRVVKGIRGAIRHRIMDILHQKGIDYCSPTTKKEFQTKEATLLKGEHIMAGCGEQPCPIRQLFGTMSEESPIKVWSDVIIQTDRPAEKISRRKGLAFVYVSTEIRHASRRDNKTLQDFSEQYFTGEFHFYVEFAKELPAWLVGLLVQGILGLTNLGNGGNSGYGRVEIKDIAYEEVTFARKLGEERNGKLAIIDDERTTNLNGSLQECLTAWNNYNN